MPFVKRTYEIREPIASFLFLMRCGYTQAQAQKIIDKGRLTQDTRIIKKGETICGRVQLCEFVPSALDLEPIFANAEFCVYDKPHNLLIHPKGAYTHISLNDALKSRYGANANAVHRLDKQTSGLVLCALNKTSERELKILMQNKGIHKEYLAIVEGKIIDSVFIDESISTQKISPYKTESTLDKGHKKDLWIKSIISPQGKSAQTRIIPIKYNQKHNTSLVRAIPLTGRTHQIRLHLSHLGHRILGDPLYGVSEEKSRAYLDSKLSSDEYERCFGAPYLCLNAYSLKFAFRGEKYAFFSKIDLIESRLKKP